MSNEQNVGEEQVVEGGVGKANAPTPEPAYITYDDFAKLEIRLGTIVEASVVENADKLFRFKVDFGDYERQILSGIREFFSGPEELVGKQCPFVVNLQPRVIRGFESQGMILAASNGDLFGLLTPHQPLPPGSVVL